MTTIRKSASEFQPSDDVLQQIIASTNDSDYARVRTLLTQSLRPKTKKDRTQQSSTTGSSSQWHHLLILLQMYVCSVQCDVQSTTTADDISIPPEWSNTGKSTSITTIPNEIYRLLTAYSYYRQKNYSKVIHLYQQQKELTSNQPRNAVDEDEVVPTNTRAITPTKSSLPKIRMAWEHLYGQSLFHMKNGNVAVQVYLGLLEQHASSSSSLTSVSPSSLYSQEHVLQIRTNYIALLISSFSIPYCRTDDTHNEMITNIRQSVLLQSSKQDNEENTIGTTTTTTTTILSLQSDLAYNVATYYLQTTTATNGERQDWLQVLFSYCNTKNQHHHQQQQQQQQQRWKDQFSLRLNYKLFREYYWNMPSSSSSPSSMYSNYYGSESFAVVNDTGDLTQLSSQQQCVYRMNDGMFALQQQQPTHYNTHSSSSSENILQSLISDYMTATSLIDEKKQSLVLTNFQQHVIHYNIAIHQYYCQQYTDCRQTCQQYFLSSTGSKSSRKKKKSTTTTSTVKSGSSTDRTVFEVLIPVQYQTTDEQLFWECRATILHAYCNVAMALSQANSSTSADNGSTTTIPDESIHVISSAIEMLNPFCVLSSLHNHSADVQYQVLLYAKLHQTALRLKLPNQTDSSTVALQMLESLPEVLRTKPMIQSTIKKQMTERHRNTFDGKNATDCAGQHHPIVDKLTLLKLDDMIQSVRTSKTTLCDDGTSMQLFITYADFALYKQRYADATVLFEALIDYIKRGNKKSHHSNPEYAILMAKLVRALSYIQPNDAIEVWSNVTNGGSTVPDLIPADNGMNGAELEMKDIIFHNTMAVQQQRQASTLTDVSDIASKRKKSHEAVLRQRAKKRELFLQQKINGSSTAHQQPDPERWISKYERSNYTKYRRNKRGVQHQQHSKNSQGIVSLQDMAKLDIVAHQAATAAAMVENNNSTNDSSTIAALRSTAHMNVSGKGKKRR